MVKLTEALGDEVTGMQMVGGGGKTKGLFGTAIVIQCKSATQTKALLKEKTGLVTELLQDVLSAEEKDLKTAKVTYTKGAETIGSVQVDSMEITSKEIKNISPHDRKEMAKVLGEDKLRVLVAEVDPKTVILSFGGGTETMAQAIQAAQRGGTIARDPGVAAVQKYLPKERLSEMYFSPKNLFSTIQAGMVKMGEKSNLPPTFRFKSNLPIAMSSTVNGTSNAAVMFVPTDTIIDIVHWAQEENKAQRRRSAEMRAKWEAESNARNNAADPMIVEEVEIE
jgi:hypothetical protein